VRSVPGLDSWSRHVVDRAGHTWHILDNAVDNPRVTLLCVHGNPTWSFLWRSLLAQAPADVRVIAVDQLHMGWSDRPPGMRRLRTRVNDLNALTDALDLRGPVVTVAHDWGGPISLGWVLQQRAHSPIDVRGIVLMNTSVEPVSRTPLLIQLANAAPLRWLGTVATPMFLRTTLGLTRRATGERLDPAAKEGYLAPYVGTGGMERRRAIGDFVADIPISPEHPSADDLRAIAEGTSSLADVPVFLAWGARDPVFSDRYLKNLRRRFPHADVHIYSNAGHLVIEDDPRVTGDVLTWIRTRVLDHQQPPPRDGGSRASDLVSALREAVAMRPDEPALTVMQGRGGDATVVTWRELDAMVQTSVDALQRRAVSGRVAILVPPGPEAIAAIYACWRIGAAVVIADRGLGIRAMRSALRSAAPDFVISIARGRVLAWTIGLRKQTIPVSELSGRSESSSEVITPPPGDALAAVVFTSGSTGPSKGVRYTHDQVMRTCDALRSRYSLTSDDVLIAAFAPWAILGPALGISSVIPAMDVSNPSSLRARALADSVRTHGGTVLWASPAALTTVVSTLDDAGPGVIEDLRTLRLVLCAGAPVPPGLLAEVARIVPQAEIRTPYGMTEVLPVAETDHRDIVAAGVRDGVLVGRPLPGVDVRIDGMSGARSGIGEILVAAPHMRDGYDYLWATDAESPAGWHRTGDVGWLDDEGRLWISGRRSHVIDTANGIVTPVGIEQTVQRLPWVRWCAAVGVGPRGAQSVVVIVTPPVGTGAWAGFDRSREVRDTVCDALGIDVAAVLQRAEFPVDVRHRAKIDRVALAEWASHVLAGHT